MNEVERMKDRFIKRIDEVDRSRRTYKKFDDFLELSYCSLAKPVYVAVGDTERAEQLEAQYMSIVQKYDDKTAVRELYPELLGITIKALEHRHSDFLGTVSSELGVLNPKAGQFFTPYSVSRMMAQMMYPIDDIIADQGYIKFHEPACGAGGMILAMADVLIKSGYNPTYKMLVQAVDVSPTAYYMAYIQLSLRGIPAQVVMGNTLTLETRTSAWTIGAYLFLCRHGHLFDNPNDNDSTLPDEAITVEPDYTIRTNQLSLFGD